MKRYSVTEVREQLSEILNRIAYCGDNVVLTRHGKDIAIIVDVRHFRREVSSPGHHCAFGVSIDASEGCPALLTDRMD